MPPPVDFSDSGTDSTGGSIPYGDHDDGVNNAMEIDRKSPAAPEKREADDGDDEEDSDEEEEDVYVVERVLGHDFAKNGTLLLQVKWKGYDKPEDETMEPEENLIDGAKDILEAYYKKQGGRPVKPKPAKSGPKKRKSLPEPSAKKETPKKRNKLAAPQSSEEESQADNSHGWVPKGKNWETQVDSVETILRDKDGKLYSYLNWNNGKKSKIAIETCYERCPQKMLHFYEQHLVFKDEAAS